MENNSIVDTQQAKENPTNKKAVNKKSTKPKKSFTEEFFIFPVGQHSNEQIAKYLDLSQFDINTSSACYVGKSRIDLPVYWAKPMQYGSLKKSNLSFYAFHRTTKEGRIHYLHSQKAPKNKKDLDPETKRLVELVEKFEAAAIAKSKKES